MYRCAPDAASAVEVDAAVGATSAGFLASLESVIGPSAHRDNTPDQALFSVIPMISTARQALSNPMLAGMAR